MEVVYVSCDTTWMDGVVSMFWTKPLVCCQGWPVCDTAAFSWCGSGELEGFWATPNCREDADACLEVLHVHPSWDTGNFELVSKANQLRFVYAYLGTAGLLAEEVVNEISAGRIPLFIYWEPDAFLLRSDVHGARIQFPDYYLGCDVQNTKNPETGHMSCDFMEDPLQTFAAARLRMNAPEAYHFLT
eukprot:1694409-Amphidinium_carterae.1